MKTSLLLLALLAIAPSPLLLQAANAACTPAPQPGCRLPAAAHHSTLAFQQTGPTDPDDIFTWKWLRGSQTSVADFGDPLTATAYVFCLYDQSARPQPVVEDAADDPQGWDARPGGFLYRAREPHALRSLRLHAGVDGKATLRAHGDSDTLAPLLPFTPSVTVQVQASNGECWQTDFTLPSRSDAVSFRARD